MPLSSLFILRLPTRSVAAWLFKLQYFSYLDKEAYAHKWNVTGCIVFYVRYNCV